MEEQVPGGPLESRGPFAFRSRRLPARSRHPAPGRDSRGAGAGGKEKDDGREVPVSRAGYQRLPELMGR